MTDKEQITNNFEKDIIVLTKAELVEQLISKTQECEELKKNNKIICDLYESVDLCLQKRTEKFDSYRKALEEIEDYCSSKIKSDFDFIEAYTPILNIINKAKGEGNG